MDPKYENIAKYIEADILYKKRVQFLAHIIRAVFTITVFSVVAYIAYHFIAKYW